MAFPILANRWSAALVAVGIWLAPSSASLADETIRFAYGSNVSFAPSILAAALIGTEQDVFKPYGLKVEARSVPSGTVARDLLISGDIDFGAMSEVPFLLSAATGTVAAIAVESYAGKNIALMVRKGAGIDSPEKLKGKTIASKVGSGIDKVLKSKVMPAFGFTPEDYKVVNINFPDQLAAISSGSVDVMAGGEPFNTLGQQAGIVERLVDFYKFDRNPLLLVARREIIEEKPKAVVAFLSGYLDAIKLLKTNRPLVLKIVGKLYVKYPDLTDAMIAQMVDNLVIDPSLSEELEAILRETVAFLQESGKIEPIAEWKEILRRDLYENAAHP